MSLFVPVRRLLDPSVLCLIVVNLLLCAANLIAQTEQLPYLNAGPQSVFAQVDFARMFAQEQALDESARSMQSALIDSGTVSALDLAAPDNAIKQLKEGTSALKGQRTEEAIRCFQKAVKIYPDFVSAHNALGLAYLEGRDDRARAEFEIAAKLDDRIPGPFLNLGLIAIGAGDFAQAESYLQKAAGLTTNDPQLLSALAFAQYGNHRYEESLQTVERIHALQHHGFANAHYIGAASAIALHDHQTAQTQLTTFLSEDSTNPLAPVARQRLHALSISDTSLGEIANGPAIQELPSVARMQQVTFPNSPYLESQLRRAGNEADSDVCASCTAPPPLQLAHRAAEWPKPILATWNRMFTIRQFVDETALFFSASHHGRSVNDLTMADVEVRDGNEPPETILQFIPQSQLPLRLGLLIDTSESVRERLDFEKRAAEKFIDKVLTGASDLAFIGGFHSEVSITQDFSGDSTKLIQGIEKLKSGGDGTSMFDAVFYACWKLSAYPDEGRTAKVLVLLTDGEDNASQKSLTQAMDEAEAAGVAVYTVSTAEMATDDTDADKILKIIAERSGGASMFPGHLRALDMYLDELPQAIRSRYLIAYRPANFQPDGKFRPVRVKAAKDGKRLRVQVRKGYYARSTSAGK